MPAPTAPLAGRYRFQRLLDAQPGSVRWLALDTTTNDDVMAVSIDAQQAAALERSIGVVHVHLAAILKVITKPEPEALPEGAPEATAVAIVEYVPGVTLNRSLEKGKIQAFKAVVWFTRLVDALEALHGHGGIHEAISPRSIVIEPSGRPIAPVFSQLATPAIGAYCSPERLRGGYPTPADDVWSLHATLYAAISGVPPYLAGSRSDILARIGRGKPMPLSELGVEEPDLQRILEAGLDPDRRTRMSELGELKKALDCFDRGAPLPERYRAPAVPRVRMDSRPDERTGPLEDGIVFDEASLPADPSPEEPDERALAASESDTSTSEAPAPAIDAAAAVRTEAPAEAVVQARPAPALAARPAPPSSGKRVLVAGGAAVGLAIAGGGIWWFSGAEPAAGAGHVIAAPLATAAPTAEASGKAHPVEDRDACVASYFADGTFDGNTTFAFLCESDALIDGSRKLYMLLRSHDPLPDAGSDAGAGAGALVIRRGTKNPPLGWYELATTAIIRQGCCKSATPPALPKTEGWCPQLDDRVRVLAAQSTTSADLSASAKRFDEAVACLFATKTKHDMYPWPAPPADPDRNAFQQFLTHVAISDAKRSSLMRR